MRLYIYNLTVSGLQIFLEIATQMEHDFIGLVAKIATGGFLQPLMLVL